MPPKRATRLPVKPLERKVPRKMKLVANQKSRSLRPVTAASSGARIAAWDAFSAAPDEEECCHNTKNIGSLYGPVYAVPYDFDWSGLVDARYARPDRSLGTRSVRERVYRGICHTGDQLDRTLQLFLAQRDALYALFRGQEGLEEKELERALEYFDDFYETITEPGRVKRQMADRCRR